MVNTGGRGGGVYVLFLKATVSPFLWRG
ncbi:unnamed protein product [Ectocarpus sp. CCAP 1310/34]|nr:unnamed protein product [Ectocarpus sp. CCAP 1310/34]